MTNERGPDQTVSVPGLESASEFGMLRVTTSASLAWLVDGYVAARGRLRAAAAVYPPDARATFQPLFEALNWAATIDDYARDKQRGGRPFDDEILAGVRFARNRVHHQWADAIDPAQMRSISRVGEAETASEPWSWWFWKHADDLPAAEKPWQMKGRRAYRQQLQGHLVDEALDHLETLFRARLAETS